MLAPAVALLLSLPLAGPIGSAMVPVPQVLLGKWEPLSRACAPGESLTVSGRTLTYSGDPGSSTSFRVNRAEADAAWLETDAADHGIEYVRLKLAGTFLGRPELEVASSSERDAVGDLKNPSRCWYVRPGKKASPP